MESHGEREAVAALELFWKRSEKKCKESGGKGILIIESRGGQPWVQNFSSKNVEKANSKGNF